MKNVKWGNFVIEKLFHLKRGKRLIKKDRKYGKIPYYSASDSNNGLTDFISNPLFVEKNKIIVTTFGNAFFVEGEFTTSDEITILDNNEVNRYSGLFVCEMIKNNIEKFKFGYKCFSDRLKRQTIMLPMDENNDPDWNFMESYIKEKEKALLIKYNKYLKNKLDYLKKDLTLLQGDLHSKEWREFKINQIFSDLKRGKRLKNEDHIEGKMPYISALGKNNGVDDYISNKSNVRIFSNCLTLANTGTNAGASFYQPFEFVSSDHVTRLANNNFNKHVYLFIGVILRRLSDKYGFSREISDKRLKRESIMLPIDENSDPDWIFMESYMKKLEYEKISKDLNYIGNRIK